MEENIVEKVTKVLKQIKDYESKIKDLKDLNRQDKDAIISYMIENKKRTLGDLELKIYKGNHYLAILPEVF